MLKYFKRQKSQRAVENGANDVAIAEKRHSLLSTSSFCDEILAEEHDAQSIGSLSIDAANITDEDIFSYVSKLSMSLTSIIKDTDCLSCFVQYLEAKNALPLIKFYLDIENFRLAALSQQAKLQNQTQLKTKTKNSPIYNENEAKNDNFENGYLEEVEIEPANNVPELKTLCDLSMHKPLTDDEKSKIYAETNKQITKCTSSITFQQKKSCSQLSLASELSVDETQAQGISAASIKDAIVIYQKYLCPDAQLFLELPVALLSDISLLLCKCQDELTVVDDDDLSISACCFDDAQHFVLNEMERLFLTDFLQSPYYCKFCVELVSDDEKRAQNLTIYDILYSEVTLFYFMEFLEQHDERECLDFWTAAINFRKSYFHAKTKLENSQEIQDDAMIIYKKFFSLEAEERLWLSDKLRCRVEASICAPPEQIANCFDLALMVTAKYLEKKYLDAFFKSELFEQYVNELRTKIQESHYANYDNFEDASVDASILQHNLSLKQSKQKKLNTPNSKRRHHRKTLSDCTNEASRYGELFKHISQKNTLLAMDTSSMHFKNLSNNTSNSMNIDSRHLTNPNLLWHRRYSTTSGDIRGSSNGGLKFGRVNSLGRYERDFESIESSMLSNQHALGKHQWSLGVSGSKIKNAMRKLVNLPEHKAQEEIAWQIAEMIVNDVTSITLKDSPLMKRVEADSDPPN